MRTKIVAGVKTKQKRLFFFLSELNGEFEIGNDSKIYFGGPQSGGVHNYSSNRFLLILHPPWNQCESGIS